MRACVRSCVRACLSLSIATCGRPRPVRSPDPSEPTHCRVSPPCPHSHPRHAPPGGAGQPGGPPLRGQPQRPPAPGRQDALPLVVEAGGVRGDRGRERGQRDPTPPAAPGRVLLLFCFEKHQKKEPKERGFIKEPAACLMAPRLVLFIFLSLFRCVPVCCARFPLPLSSPRSQSQPRIYRRATDSLSGAPPPFSLLRLFRSDDKCVRPCSDRATTAL